ncbi:hypothetical protein [Polaribacter sp. SA4-12]|uniref:hypothetical protein n=1 Tax=Polaribacter sp. SA4-12 TaxID=1312072 RepID=UPI000B3CBCB1|nr:hypothetical protein [Polaribacter sp. SA4-12]ARV14743.1 hypothetical protein BTO07_06085 [Polaribacter sp. SA4-12]
METKKIKYFIYLIILCVSYSCIPSIGNIDEAEESGYELIIRNYSEKDYTGFIFYNGVINDNNKFVIIDSIEYENFIIPNKNIGDNVSGNGEKSSIIRPFMTSHPKLTKFNTWAPPSFEKINEISPEAKVSLKFLLHENNKSIVKTPNGIGTVYIDILEDGSLR